ncbi:hypothetical protein [Alkalicoccobacillus porphyridii]|uniref:Uncharacterized protein n=1 Tax=Alkalicoccobacillus porphyridii TaxID=2597270 RepID=A0A553ZXJ0_9BACI|nr:hypothetical protein [Alkalicoccobacillus porphyridii]TSB46154.1 hypothetical protein FN960_12380 [Alkalicoccobacillus porphyridii]
MEMPDHNKEKEFIAVLTPAIHSTYKKLAASRYFTASHLELISSEAKNIIHTQVKEMPLLGYYIYINGVFSLCHNENALEQTHRRFEHFFGSLGDKLIEHIAADRDAVSVTSFLKRTTNQIKKTEGTLFSPWPKLVQQLVPHLSGSQIEKIDEQLRTHSFHFKSADAILIKSYVTLLAGREKEALEQLTQRYHKWSEQQVTPHFRCLEKRTRWKTILVWLKQLFPDQRNGRYGSLQSFADKSKSQLNESGDLLPDVWDRWLLAPSFQRYTALTAHESQEKKEQIIKYVLPRLKKQLHQSQTVQVYVKLLKESKSFETAAEYFLLYERNPLRLQEEKEQLLEDMMVKAPKLVIPIFHQFVVRLAEKKSRAHYERAAYYVNQLRLLYSNEHEMERFQEYMRLMKSEYKTYRAFIKELNVIHA